MAKKTVRDIDVVGKRVLVRVDFNVPLKEGSIKDDTRIRAALPTIIYLRSKAAKVILTSHLGRPKNAPEDGLKMDPVAARLSELLGAPVRKLDQLSGPEVEVAVAAMKPGDVILLENSRFDPREKKNDPSLAAELAKLADVYVDDAFGTAHRAHATTEGVAKLLPAVSGLLMEKELSALDTVVLAPGRPFAVVMGGAKVTDKIGVIDRFLDIADDILIGGAMCFTFFKAQGLSVGASLVEDEEGVAVAKKALDKAAESHCDLHPAHRRGGRHGRGCRRRHQGGAGDGHPRGLDGSGHRPGDGGGLPSHHRESRRGLLERPHGHVRVGAVRQGNGCGGTGHGDAEGMSVVGGGDSVAAVNGLGLAEQMDHVSTGGGASLEFIESGGVLPGVTVLEDKPEER